MGTDSNIFDKSKRPVGRPRKKEYFKRAYTVTFNEKVIYTLILSNITIGTKYPDRFNTKEQVEWLKLHNGETRKGVLLDVYEKVPKGYLSFKDVEDEKRKKSVTKYSGKIERKSIARKFIARIKDDKEGYIFYINLWNVEFEKNYLNVIAEKMCIPYGWIVNRDRIISGIGVNFEDYVKEHRDENFKNRHDRKEDIFKRKIGTSKLAYDREVNKISSEIKAYRRKIAELDSTMMLLEEYWSEIEEEKKTI